MTPPLPILLDTDIGTDIDDAYALLLAARSPELALRGVTTVNGDTALRAAIARRLLRHMGDGDVPVIAGASAAITPGVQRGWGGHEGRGIDLSAEITTGPTDPEGAARFIAETVGKAHSEGNPLTVVPIGAMTNVANAILQHPQEMRLARGIVAMASTFEGFGQENARGEHNVACDPDAFQIVLDSGLPVTLIGLNVTRQTSMTAEFVDRLEARGGPLTADLVGMHRVWFEHIGRDHSPMHDGLAVAALFRPDMLRLAPVKAKIDRTRLLDGVVIYNEPQPGEVTTCRIATSVQAAEFEALLEERIFGM